MSDEQRCIYCGKEFADDESVYAEQVTDEVWEWSHSLCQYRAQPWWKKFTARLYVSRQTVCGWFGHKFSPVGGSMWANLGSVDEECTRCKIRVSLLSVPSDDLG